MKLFEMLGTYSKVGDVTHVKPTLVNAMNQPAGGKWAGVYPTKEDQDDPNIKRIAEKIGSIPVATAFILPQSPKLGDWDNKRKVRVTAEDIEQVAMMKDALKSRNPFHVMADEDIRAVAEAAVDKITKIKATDPSMRGRQDATIKAIRAVQIKLKSSDAVLVPLASSSNLVYLFAETASKKLNIPLLRGFQKRVGKLSAYRWDAKTNQYLPRPKTGEEDLDQKLDRMYKELEALYNRKDVPPEQIQAAEKAYTEFRDKAERQSTKHWTYRKNVMGVQEIVDEEMLNLEGKDVIFVDDNIYRGFTISDAALAFARLGIEPKSISGIMMHQFYDIRK